jgi:hypothetical protein
MKNFVNFIFLFALISLLQAKYCTDRGGCDCDCSWANTNTCRQDDYSCCFGCCCGSSPNPPPNPDPPSPVETTPCPLELDGG